MQNAKLIGQTSYHPMKNKELQDLIKEGGIDYPNTLKEQEKITNLILSNASVRHPIPCDYPLIGLCPVSDINLFVRK